MKATIKDIKRNVYGVAEINERFQRKIQEICFQQIKMLTLGELR